ncbi:MAG: glycosyltransferase [Euryarchaeota archaeon TMED192]|nr:MAG: glycosyltransferase [Euryarchaeota archaeon TMED192]|tara:strand:+ start:621 stop:1724 length:1104 start_codon:yes stop_codon:yes gene_type:complete
MIVQHGDEGGPRATILIPTINNPQELRVVLEHLLEDSDGTYDILVVDSSNNSETSDLCLELGVERIADSSRTRADACNNGLSVVKTAYTLFTDDDVIPPSGWVKSLIRWFDRGYVAGVGGTNFAPEEDPWLSKCTDVAFGARLMTAGTRYGARPDAELVEVTHNPGVNVAYRTEVLREVGGFDEGAIGAEDVLLDSKIVRAGYRLFLDPSCTMPHRRRPAIIPMMRQIRNYGYVRRLAIDRDPSLRSPTHGAVQMFPFFAAIAALALTYGAASGGAQWDLWFTLEGEWNFSRASFHFSLGATSLYLLMCIIGAATGTSPHRSVSTVFASCITIPAAHLAYGWGMMKAEWGLLRGSVSIAAIDDKERS